MASLVDFFFFPTVVAEHDGIIGRFFFPQWWQSMMASLVNFLPQWWQSMMALLVKLYAMMVAEHDGDRALDAVMTLVIFQDTMIPLKHIN